MKVVAIIQARMGSTRLPGKVMRQLEGKSVLARVVERVRACRHVDVVVVATTTAPIDDVVVEEAMRCDAGLFRGSEHDVLSRYWGAAHSCAAETVVRATSDCPLFDPEVLSRMLARYFQAAAQGRRLDYLSNAIQRTYPRGLDAEIVSFEALTIAHERARLPHEREHVTPYIYQHPSEFSIENYSDGWALQHHRWTLDTPEDWALISAIYSEFSGRDSFSTAEVAELLARRPDLVALNASIEQKAMPGQAT